MTPASPRLRGALALFLTANALPAAAVHLQVQGGRSYMDAHGANAAFVEATFAPHAWSDSGLLDWSPDVSLGWIDGRHLDRYRKDKFETYDPVALLAVGARLHYGASSAWYRRLYFSFQLAGANHTTQALSSHYQFVSTVGWQGRHLSFHLRHVSNAGLNGPNRGETMALVGVGFDL